MFPEPRVARGSQLKRQSLGSIISMRLLSTLTLGLLAAACGRPVPSVSPAVEAVLDSLVSGLRIGQRAGPIAEQLHIGFLPYAGFSDTTFRNSRGVRGLTLFVNENLTSESHRPSKRARISQVGIGFESRQANQAAHQLLIRQLGPPEVFCSMRPDEPRVGLYFWPDLDSTGVMLHVPVDTSDYGGVMVETYRPDTMRTASGPCDAA